VPPLLPRWRYDKQAVAPFGHLYGVAVLLRGNNISAAEHPPQHLDQSSKVKRRSDLARAQDAHGSDMDGGAGSVNARRPVWACPRSHRTGSGLMPQQRQKERQTQ
jgi:hypothetical protein